MVADTHLLSKYADILIYVCKLDYLDKRMLSIPLSIYQDKNFKNMIILLNGSNNIQGSSYGYGYGYGYGNEENEKMKKPFFQRMLKFKNKI